MHSFYMHDKGKRVFMKKSKFTTALKKLLFCSFTAMLLLTGILPGKGKPGPNTPKDPHQMRVCDERPTDDSSNND